VLTDGLQGLAYGNACQGAPSYEDAKMNMRLLLASKDPVAIDSVHSCIIGVDPEKVKHLKDLAKDGFGTIDTSHITVVGNARVDEVKKRFALPDGMLGHILSSGSKKAVYEDFEAPEISIKEVTINKKTLIATLKTNPKTAKVEIHIDGQLVETVRGGFDLVQLTLEKTLSKGSHEVTFYAYDRFLNCGHTTTDFAR
jgi:hypothetical protein